MRTKRCFDRSHGLYAVGVYLVGMAALSLLSVIGAPEKLGRAHV